jgi:hypothetical protein
LIDSVYFHSPYTLPEHPANHRSNQINRNPNRNRNRVSDVSISPPKLRPISIWRPDFDLDYL